MTYQKELAVAKQAVKFAGQFLRVEFDKWHRGQAKYKDAHELVTWCDQRSEKIIIQHLKKHFPQYSVLSEENGSDKKIGEIFWTVDPLDGTSNFTVHNSLFAVSLSLVYKNKIVLGVTYLPMLDEMYWAAKGQGAWRNNHKLKASNIKKLDSAFITYGHGQTVASHKKAYKLYEYFHLQARDCRHFGSTSFELALVAAGYTDAFLIAQPRLWDVAAGIILIQEAGGQITDFYLQPWHKNSYSLLATNNWLGKTIQNRLKKLKLINAN